MSLPADIVNRALDAAGAENAIGDVEEGTFEARIALRHYGPVLRQLTRAAHWDCCRRQAPMQLLADASGQTNGVGTQVPAPWTYEYAYPTDCMKIRFIPANTQQIEPSIPPNNIQLPSTPLTTGGTPPSNNMRLRPTRFLVATDYNNTAQVTTGPNGTPWWEIQGVSPTNRTVVLSNVQNAQAVYTCLQTAPSLWDPLFEAAFVAALAAEMAVPLHRKDPKTGLAFRAQNITIAKDKIHQARITDGNEMWASSDIAVDWIKVRSSGAWGSNWWGPGAPGPGVGVWGYGFDSYNFGDGSAY